ncbi:MAG: Mitochondrial intermediate peptidase [Candelina submexicana]|nr:MAG: Mitochondrial intermediate peptidase [Candelina submexicana]
MLKPLTRQTWTCTSCLFRQQSVRRRLATAAPAGLDTVRDGITLSPTTHQTQAPASDDSTLRQIFDSQQFWQAFSGSAQASNLGRSTGLFRNQYLTSPEGFGRFASITLQKCRKIVAKVLAASTLEEYKAIVMDLDRLSDLLCRVIDLSDFVRSNHPDRKIQKAASEAHALMFEYMNVLNTTTGLNDQLKVAAANPEISTTWSEQESLVAQILIKDFSRSAIDLPANDRQKFINLSNDISQLGPLFVDNLAPQNPYISFESSKLKGMDPTVVKELTRGGTTTLPAIGRSSTLALKSVQDEKMRKRVYVGSRTASYRQIYILEKLLRRRAQLARLSGYKSFAHMALDDKMARSPGWCSQNVFSLSEWELILAESVNTFLMALKTDIRKRVEAEHEELLKLKRLDPDVRFPSQGLNAWDKDYYISKLLSSSRSKSRESDFLSAFFSLGTVMQGLSRLFTSLYGVRFAPRATPPGETWNDDVRRIDVMDESEGHIAVVYCDLFERTGKSQNPAHFTLRCSRRIKESEIEEMVNSDHGFATLEDAANDGMASARNDKGELYQLPTIALVCDFSRGPSHRPVLLSYREVQTLFHEMGHAIHSILGRTTLQNVAGTRCATDFAELPSVLMEHFASAPEVLKLFARHWETDAPLPYRMVKETVDFDRRLSGSETESQIILAFLDQAYHSSIPLSLSFDSTRVYHEVHDRHSSLAEPPETSWHGYFGHLFGYGATYYSYLFDRAIAGKVWKDVFQQRKGGAVDRQAGSVFREQVLRWGGGRDGWKCLAGALNDPSLAEGGPTAMAEVGRWGVNS